MNKDDGVAQPLLRQRHGDLLECLLELAAEIRLLVMGAYGHSRIREFLVASTTTQMLRTTTTPLLLLR